MPDDQGKEYSNLVVHPKGGERSSTSAADQSGQLLLTLTLTPDGGCLGESNVIDTKIITVDSVPVISGPSTDTHCQLALNDRFQVSGIQIQNTTSYNWEILPGATGNLSANNVANPFYTPSLNDYQNGSVTLRLTAISVGECSPNNPTH